MSKFNKDIPIVESTSSSSSSSSSESSESSILMDVDSTVWEDL